MNKFTNTLQYIPKVIHTHVNYQIKAPVAKFISFYIVKTL